MTDLAIAGHMTIDEILGPDGLRISLGGSPCYAGLMARTLGSDVRLVTKVGTDLPRGCIPWLRSRHLELSDDSFSSTMPTTRFLLIISGEGRRLRLLSRCEQISEDQLPKKSDGFMIDPVAGEVDETIVAEARKRSWTIYLDPQGFLRRFGRGGSVRLGARLPASLVGAADILKVGEEEAKLVFMNDDLVGKAAMLASKMGKIIILTFSDRRIILLTDRGRYSLRVSDALGWDTTGLGDIFGGAFLHAYISSRETIWALTLGASAAKNSVGRVGVSKIPDRRIVQEEAESLRELVVSER